MADSKIRWKRGDFISLGRAVSDFNKKVNALKTEENKIYLPETINYKELKENIITRKELNRTINSLRRFQKEGAENLYITGAGEFLTNWERKELGIMSRSIQAKLRTELKKLNEPLESGYSRAQMGSLRVQEIKAQIANIKKIETLKGYDFISLKKRIERAGKSDYEMKKAENYRRNYLKEMEKYSHFDNYDLLMKKLNSFTNPLSFYDFVSANEITGDLTYQSDESYTQEAFNSFLTDLGIEPNDTMSIK